MNIAGVQREGRAKKTVGDILVENAYPVWLCSFSALDSYLGLPSLPYVLAETEADITVLAQIFENLRFPGANIADAATEDAENRVWYFHCRDSEDPTTDRTYSSYRMLSLTQEFQSRRFWDRCGIYSQIRKLRDHQKESDLIWWEDINPGGDRIRLIMEGALILARYGAVPAPPLRFDQNPLPDFLLGDPETSFPTPEAQRILLSCLMVSPRPDRGLEFLRRTGLLETLWPELAALDDVDHSKEFHPEGNAWKHTLETFRHRKEGQNNLLLSLGLLLHDLGKPAAETSGKRRFDGHAELGAAAARRFLKRLEFEDSLIEDVYFLVRNHMLPAALGRLPIAKTKVLMDSHLFPVLLELYRCDESSSFKGPEGYYKSSAVYRTYLRNSRNPYRSADGKVLGGRI